MTTLTPEQRQAVLLAGGELVRLKDEVTQQDYVLLRADAYERLHDLASSGLRQDLNVPEGIRRSKDAYLRDLPDLLRDETLRGKWVVYHGEERIGIADTQSELVRECIRRGLRDDEIYEGMILPYTPGPETLDFSLFEFTSEPRA